MEKREFYNVKRRIVFMLLVNLLKNLEQSTFSKHIMNNKQGKVQSCDLDVSSESSESSESSNCARNGVRQ